LTFRELFENKTYDIVYIEGNKKYLSKEDHNELKNAIISMFPNYNVKVIQSNSVNTDHIPKAKVYIGFSQGTRYFKKLNDNSLKISIGGISGPDIIYLKNPKDNVRKKDFSDESLKAHFTLTDKMKRTLKSKVLNYIKKPDNKLKSLV